MAKLVLFLQDGTTLDIPLAKERTTIGRRADNDVCLPYPAVSGEHAAVVTILADSFLEDLGSTNGTLVNGKRVGKHFLRDRDEVDIGRQRLVYVVDDAALPDALPPAHLRNLAEQAAAARPPGPPADALRQEPARPPAPRPALDPAERGRPPAAVEEAPAFVVDTEAEALPELPAAEETTPLARYELRVLTGPSAGRRLPVAKDEVVVGRVGLQVAAIRRDGDACRLFALEGAPPSVNGAAIGADGCALAAGDRIDIAGTTVELAEVL